MNEGILSAIGHTPLVQLNRFFGDAPFRIFAKMESLNPGGSVKDRAAFSILRNAMERGDIRSDTTIIESSSGNMGIGLAQACAYFGLRFICIVDEKTTIQNIEILRAYGATIDLVKHPSPVTGEFLQARLDRVKSLLSSIDNSFWPDQYSNIYNAIAHHQTMHEIVTDLRGKVDHLFCATSTCGTIRGCAEYVKDHHLATKIWAVDAVGSVIFGCKSAKRLIPGHGAAVRPKLFRTDIADRCIHLSDLDCIVGCRRLVRQEAILAGGSSGAVVMALEKVKHEIPHGVNIVVILPDRGERYVDSIYSDNWVKEHFGDVAHLWGNCIMEATQ
jgi:2,3-diaminopropionate biosynthesis protein SbnA